VVDLTFLTVGRYLDVYADVLSARVDERPARVAVVDGGIGLDRIRDGEAVRRGDVAIDRADDAGSDALLVAERAADGDDAFTRLDLRTVAERERSELAARHGDPDHSRVGRGIGT